MTWRLAVTVCMLSYVAMTWGNSTWAQIGLIKTVEGEVYILRNNMKLPAKAGDLLEPADTLTTGPDGSLGIIFIDNSRFSAGPNSSFELKEFNFNTTTYEGEFLTKINSGTLAITSGHIANSSPDAMKFRTRKSILGVRGTKFLVQVKE
jgi:hypothetical protein